MTSPGHVEARSADDGAVGSAVASPARRRADPPDSGSGAVLVLAVVAAALSLVLAAGLVGSAHVISARAAAAADLAALAAAQHLADGGADPCARASEAARRNGAVVASCTPGPVGDVTVRVRASAPVGDARAVARAGPRPARTVRGRRGPGRS